MDGFEDSSVTTKPRWTTAQASALALERYGLSAESTELPSYRDQNFRMVTTTGTRFVLKVSNPAENRGILDLQDAALDYLRADGVDRRIPKPIPADGETILTAPGPDGTKHLVRLLSWVPGRPLAHTRPHSDLLEPLGCFLAVLDRRLAEFEHPAADRELCWDLRHGLDVAARYAPEITDPGRRERVERLLAGIGDKSALFETLPRQVIHGDVNDYNIMIDRTTPGPTIGLIDFGDIGRSWRIAELAILLAYAMLDKRDPLATASRIARAYHSVLPLEESEIEALFPLVCLRLCTSVTLAAHQCKRAPENDYLGVTEGPAWRLLEVIEDWVALTF